MANTIQPNNNTSLYNATGNATPVNGNITATNIDASGNVTVDGFIIANGSITTESNFVGNLVGNVTGNVTGNITLTGGNTEIIYNNSGVTGSSPAFRFNQASNVVSATGNIVASYYFGNGSQLTGITANYSNANVEALLPVYSGNLAGNNMTLTGAVTATGNVTGNYLLGNGSQLTGITANYSNANVAAYLPTFSGNLNPNFVSATGNVTAAFLKTSGAQGNIVGANYVSANFYLGDGGLLSNITSTYGNAQVATFLNAFGSNTISTTGTVTAGNVSGGNLLTAGVISATGNITGNYILGNGSQLTGLPTGYSNADVNSHLAAFGANTISTTGNITAGYFVGNGSLLSNITGANVTGTVANATFATSAGSATTATDAAQANVANVANSVAGANVTGSVSQANVANTANAVTGGNVSGQVANALVAGTVYTNAQPNITSLGTLSALSVTGNIATGGILTDGYYYANGTPFTGGGSTYGNANVNTLLATWGSNTISTTGTVTAGNITGGNVLTGGIISATGNIQGGNIVTAGAITATGNVTAAYLFGNGSQLTGISATPAGNNLNFQYNNSNVFGGVPNTAFYTGNGVIEIASAKFEAGAGPSSQITVPGTAGYVSVVGNVIAGNVTTAGVISAAGNITAANLGNVSALNLNGNSSQVLYGNGVFAGVAGGGGTPGGSDSQIQFNDGGAFGGNVAMTFNDSTGNITLGNIVTNVNKIQTVASIDQANVTAFGTATPWRILAGNGYTDGTANSVYATFVPGTVASVLNSSRVLNADFVSMPNNGSRYIQGTNFVWAALTANASNTSTRVGASRSEMTLGGGANNFSYTANGINSINAHSVQMTLGRGTNANLSAVGNISITSALGTFSGVTVQAGSSATAAIGMQSFITATNDTGNIGTAGYGNATNQVAYYAAASTGLANTAAIPCTTYVSYYHPSSTSNNLGLSYATGMGNTARNATNYHAFRNDDDLAQAKLGMLSRFHEQNANTATTTGTVNIDKTSGQVQTIYPTGNVTVGTFSNFVTRVQKPDATQVNTADTVTVIIQQGATPYTVTMPTGNANIRYAGNISTVPSTANTTVMLSITGTYNYQASANQYLITISPEFS